MDINNSSQVSRVIADSATAANAIVTLKATLERYDVEQSVNGVHAALTANGAQFPAAFTVPPALVEDARFAIASFRSAFETSLATYQASLDALRLHLGVLTGTG